MAENVDRRKWSITARGLSEFVGDLSHQGVRSTSVRALHKTLKDGGIYPARDFAHRCKPILPDAFFTYHSAQNFVDIREIVWKAFDFAARLYRERHPEDKRDLEPVIADGITCWIDFMFIDQCARDIPRELDVLPVLLNAAAAHFVLGDQPLTRSWCCYEIALFNQRHVAETTDKMQLRSFIAPTTSIYFGWQDTKTTEANDKTFIEERIRRGFPHGFKGFNQIMEEANGTAVLSSTEVDPFYPPAALDSLASAAERWFTRALPK